MQKQSFPGISDEYFHRLMGHIWLSFWSETNQIFSTFWLLYGLLPQHHDPNSPLPWIITQGNKSRFACIYGLEGTCCIRDFPLRTIASTVLNPSPQTARFSHRFFFLLLFLFYKDSMPSPEIGKWSGLTVLAHHKYHVVPTPLNVYR